MGTFFLHPVTNAGCQMLRDMRWGKVFYDAHSLLLAGWEEHERTNQPRKATSPSNGWAFLVFLWGSDSYKVEFISKVKDADTLHGWECMTRPWSSVSFVLPPPKKCIKRQHKSAVPIVNEQAKGTLKNDSNKGLVCCGNAGEETNRCLCQPLELDGMRKQESRGIWKVI